jgi:hypothetical protein
LQTYFEERSGSAEAAAEKSGGKKMTAWVGPHPDGQEKGEKELKSQEGRVLIFLLSSPSLLVFITRSKFLATYTNWSNISITLK